MKVDIRYKPSYSLGFISLESKEDVRVEGGSMVSMSDGISIETEATGGLLSSISRKMFGGEKFFWPDAGLFLWGDPRHGTGIGSAVHDR